MVSLIRICSQIRWSVALIVNTCTTNINTIIQNDVAGPQSSAIKLVRQQRLQRSNSILSTVENPSKEINARLNVWTNEFPDYMAVYPDILRQLCEAATSYNSDEDSAAWFEKNLRHNVPTSTEQMFGLITVVMYKSLIKKDQLTAEKLLLAQYLGWCIELLHSFFNIADDMMDESTTRRGQLCWYKLENASSTTPNDVLMMENGIYELLRKHFRHLDCYVDLLELLHEMSFKISRGQLMDFLLSKQCVSTFNMETYNAMVMDKTGCHMLYLPVAIALHLAGVKDPRTFQQCKTILIELSHFCQVQNDFLDSFGNPNITGKIGTDIKVNKCSWLAIVCMQRATPEQKTIMVECYGQNDPQKIGRVKQLYEELNIPSIYAKYEEKTYYKLKSQIQQTSNEIPQHVFLNILDFCCQR